MPINRARVSDDIGLTGDLYYTVAIDYFDIAEPTVVIWHEEFKMPRGSTTGQLQAKVVERGQEIRAAFAARDAARVAVPKLTTINVP